MGIEKVEHETHEMRRLWEQNMGEPWTDYANATKFIQKDTWGNITGCFAVYWDEADGVEGHFISGWSAQKNISSVEAVIRHLAERLGEIYIKTDKRQVKIISERLGTLIKSKDGFYYYVIKSEKLG